MKEILYVGENMYGSNSLQRMNALKRIGNTVESIDFTNKFHKNSLKGIYSRVLKKFSYGIDLTYCNDTIFKRINSKKYDILWIDKGLTIKPDIIEYAKKNNRVKYVIGYYNDDMFQKFNQTKQWLQGLPLYDLSVTTKSFNVNELLLMGAKNVELVTNGYDPTVHRPKKVSKQDKKKFGGDIGFVGAWEKERLISMLALANSGLQVKWWGGEFSGKKFSSNSQNLIYKNNTIWGDDYSTALNSFKISLCFLRKINRDLQTCRTMEIPACAGFMLAERTIEHLELFEESKEAEFFSDTDELIDKTKFYLSNSSIRKKIALAGRERCEKSNYSYDSIVLSIILKLKKL